MAVTYDGWVEAAWVPGLEAAHWLYDLRLRNLSEPLFLPFKNLDSHSIYLMFIGKVSIRTKWVKWKCLKVKVTQSHPTLCNPMDYTVHGVLQARILEWVAFPFSRGSSQPRDWTQVSHIVGRFFTNWAIREALNGLNECNVLRMVLGVSSDAAWVMDILLLLLYEDVLLLYEG